MAFPRSGPARNPITFRALRMLPFAKSLRCRVKGRFAPTGGLRPPQPPGRGARRRVTLSRRSGRTRD
jgi:hypothetical protein